MYVLRAVWALYEAEAKKEDLTVLLRWFQWAAKQWDDIAADEYVSAFPADLLELLEKFMDVAELADETATRVIFRGQIGLLAGAGAAPQGEGGEK